MIFFNSALRNVKKVVFFFFVIFIFSYHSQYALYGENNNDEFGYSIATNNNYLIVYASGYPSNLSRGAVYTFNISSGALLYNLTGQNNYDYFGYSIATTNNYVIVVARGYDSALNRGAVYTYNISTGALLVSLA